jgi:hypothetical protein
MQNTSIVVLQTADSTHYLPMLQATARVNQAYCSRHNIAYSQYVGIKRGFFPWHACFNRILLIKEMIDAGYNGWVFYLDADAFVFDQSYDVRELITRFGKPLIIGPGGASGALWDVNNGVFLVNLGNAVARDLMLAWYANFMATPEEVLRQAPDDSVQLNPGEWDSRVLSDQPRLSWLLEHNEHYRDCVGLAERGFLNSHIGSFVRQILRALTLTFEERMAWIQRETTAIVDRFESQATVADDGQAAA